MVLLLASSSLPVPANPGLIDIKFAVGCDTQPQILMGNDCTLTPALACSCESTYVRLIKLRLSRNNVNQSLPRP